MNIAIIGAGYAGLSAAYDLGRAGHQVTIYEAAPTAGGLASGFKDEGWEWPLERFYHHLFTNDDDIITFCKELGIGDKLTVYAPSTDLIHNGKPYPFDSPLNVLRFPGFSFAEKARAGATAAYLKVQRNWSRFEGITAHEWMAKAMGGAYDKQFGPLLRGKFGDDYYQSVPMTWFWSRMYKRTPKLIYPDGGFQTITDAMVRGVTAQGATLHLGTPVQSLERIASGWRVGSAQGQNEVNQVLVTTAPGLLARLVPSLPTDYLGGLRELKHLGAVVMTIALRRKLTERSYWLNLDKDDYPLLALVEHTNMVSPTHYGGDHLIYMGDYLAPDHPYLSMEADELFEVYEPVLKQFNPSYDRSWVRDKWIFATTYAQPVPTLHHAERIPALKTPLDGLYFASMSQVYPWDRGTNYAVEIGRRAAREMNGETVER